MEHIKTQSNSEKHKEGLIEYRSLVSQGFIGDISVYNHSIEHVIEILSPITNSHEGTVFTAERDYVPSVLEVTTSSIEVSSIDAVFTAERDFLVSIHDISVSSTVEVDIPFSTFTAERDFIPDEFEVSTVPIPVSTESSLFTAERDFISDVWDITVSGILFNVENLVFTGERDFISDVWDISTSSITVSTESSLFTGERDFISDEFSVSIPSYISTQVETSIFTAEIDWIIDNITREYTSPVDGTGSIFILNTFDDGAVIDTEYYTLEQPGAPIGINGGDENSPAMTFAHGVYHTFNLGNYSQGETGEVLSWPDEHFTVKKYPGQEAIAYTLDESAGVVGITDTSSAGYIGIVEIQYKILSTLTIQDGTTGGQIARETLSNNPLEMTGHYSIFLETTPLIREMANADQQFSISSNSISNSVTTATATEENIPNPAINNNTYDVLLGTDEVRYWTNAWEDGGEIDLAGSSNLNYTISYEYLNIDTGQYVPFSYHAQGSFVFNGEVQWTDALTIRYQNNSSNGGQVYVEKIKTTIENPQPDGVVGTIKVSGIITINGIDDPVVAEAATIQMDEDINYVQAFFPVSGNANGDLIECRIKDETATSNISTPNGEVSLISVNGYYTKYSYTPNHNYHGSDSFDFQVRKVGASTWTNTSVNTILANITAVDDIPVITGVTPTSNGNLQVTEQTNQDFIIHAIDVETQQSIEYFVVQGPSKGTLYMTNDIGGTTYTDGSQLTGSRVTYSHSQELSDNDTDQMVFKARSPVGAGNPYSDDFTLNVDILFQDASPTWNWSTSSLYVPEGGQNFTIPAATDPDNDDNSITYSVGTNLTSNGTVTKVASSDARLFTWTPDPNDENFHGNAGTVEFIASSNGKLIGSGGKTLYVTSVNDPPIASWQNLSTDEDTDLVIDFSQYVSDVDDAITHWDIVNTTNLEGSLSHTGNNPINTTVTYTPTANWNGDKEDNYFIYRVKDESDAWSDNATIYIDVNAVPDPPVVGFVLSREVTEDTTYNIAGTQTLRTIQDNFDEGQVSDPDDPNEQFTYSFVGNTNTSKGQYTLVHATNGTYNYTYDANAYGLDDPVTWKATDSTGLFSEAQIKYNILPINDAPVITSPASNVTVSPNIIRGSTEQIQFTGQDVDNEDVLSWSVGAEVNGSTDITATISSTGLLTISTAPTTTPATNYEFVVQLSDLDTYDELTVSGTVDSNAPEATDQTVQIGHETTTIFTLTSSDIDNNLDKFVVTQIPDNLTVFHGQQYQVSVGTQIPSMDIAAISATPYNNFYSTANNTSSNLLKYRAVDDIGLQSSIATVTFDVAEAASASTRPTFYSMSDDLDNEWNVTTPVEFTFPPTTGQTFDDHYWISDPEVVSSNGKIGVSQSADKTKLYVSSAWSMSDLSNTAGLAAQSATITCKRRWAQHGNSDTGWTEETFTFSTVARPAKPTAPTLSVSAWGDVKWWDEAEVEDGGSDKRAITMTNSAGVTLDSWNVEETTNSSYVQSVSFIDNHTKIQAEWYNTDVNTASHPLNFRVTLNWSGNTWSDTVIADSAMSLLARPANPGNMTATIGDIDTTADTTSGWNWSGFHNLSLSGSGGQYVASADDISRSYTSTSNLITLGQYVWSDANSTYGVNISNSSSNNNPIQTSNQDFDVTVTIDWITNKVDGDWSGTQDVTYNIKMPARPTNPGSPSINTIYDTSSAYNASTTTTVSLGSGTNYSPASGYEDGWDIDVDPQLFSYITGTIVDSGNHQATVTIGNSTADKNLTQQNKTATVTVEYHWVASNGGLWSGVVDKTFTHTSNKEPVPTAPTVTVALENPNENPIDWNTDWESNVTRDSTYTYSNETTAISGGYSSLSASGVDRILYGNNVSTSAKTVHTTHSYSWSKNNESGENGSGSNVQVNSNTISIPAYPAPSTTPTVNNQGNTSCSWNGSSTGTMSVSNGSGFNGSWTITSNSGAISASINSSGGFTVRSSNNNTTESNETATITATYSWEHNSSDHTGSHSDSWVHTTTPQPVPTAPSVSISCGTPANWNSTGVSVTPTRDESYNYTSIEITENSSYASVYQGTITCNNNTNSTKTVTVTYSYDWSKTNSGGLGYGSSSTTDTLTIPAYPEPTWPSIQGDVDVSGTWNEDLGLTLSGDSTSFTYSDWTTTHGSISNGTWSYTDNNTSNAQNVITGVGASVTATLDAAPSWSKTITSSGWKITQAREPDYSAPNNSVSIADPTNYNSGVAVTYTTDSNYSYANVSKTITSGGDHAGLSGTTLTGNNTTTSTQTVTITYEYDWSRTNNSGSTASGTDVKKTDSVMFPAYPEPTWPSITGEPASTVSKNWYNDFSVQLSSVGGDSDITAGSWGALIAGSTDTNGLWTYTTNASSATTITGIKGTRAFTHDNSDWTKTVESSGWAIQQSARPSAPTTNASISNYSGISYTWNETGTKYSSVNFTDAVGGSGGTVSYSISAGTATITPEGTVSYELNTATDNEINETQTVTMTYNQSIAQGDHDHTDTATITITKPARPAAPDPAPTINSYGDINGLDWANGSTANGTNASSSNTAEASSISYSIEGDDEKNGIKVSVNSSTGKVTAESTEHNSDEEETFTLKMSWTANGNHSGSDTTTFKVKTTTRPANPGPPSISNYTSTSTSWSLSNNTYSLGSWSVSSSRPADPSPYDVTWGASLTAANGNTLTANIYGRSTHGISVNAPNINTNAASGTWTHSYTWSVSKDYGLWSGSGSVTYTHTHSAIPPCFTNYKNSVTITKTFTEATDNTTGDFGTTLTVLKGGSGLSISSSNLGNWEDGYDGIAVKSGSKYHVLTGGGRTHYNLTASSASGYWAAGKSFTVVHWTDISNSSPYDYQGSTWYLMGPFTASVTITIS